MISDAEFFPRKTASHCHAKYFIRPPLRRKAPACDDMAFRLVDDAMSRSALARDSDLASRSMAMGDDAKGRDDSPQQPAPSSRKRYFALLCQRGQIWRWQLHANRQFEDVPMRKLILMPMVGNTCGHMFVSTAHCRLSVPASRRCRPTINVWPSS